jgi:hypothetical protein
MIAFAAIVQQGVAIESRRYLRCTTMRSRRLNRDLMIGFLCLSFGSFVCVLFSEYRNASRQAVGIYIICTKRNEHMVVAGIGGNGMGGARRMRVGARGHRRHAEGGHQLLEDLIVRVDYAEDRSTLSRQGRAADYLGRTQRASRGGSIVISVT